jgi:hypothetical protein
MRRFALALNLGSATSVGCVCRLSISLLLCSSGELRANDWEKYYHPVGNISETIPSNIDPEVIQSCGDTQKDAEDLFRRGFVPIGFTSFNTANNKTQDALRLAKKLQARYIVICVNMSSSHTVSVPLTLPQTTTSVNNGNVSAFGAGGSVSGSYSGTTTTYGSQTTYIPMTISRFNKGAMYFREIPRRGIGVYTRSLTNDEMIGLGTRHAIAVRFVRDGSPADKADLLPGDIITKINGAQFDADMLRDVERGTQPFTLHIVRAGQSLDISLTIPSDWQRTAVNGAR